MTKNHFTPDWIVHYIPNSVVHFTPKYSAIISFARFSIFSTVICFIFYTFYTYKFIKKCPIGYEVSTTTLISHLAGKFSGNFREADVNTEYKIYLFTKRTFVSSPSLRKIQSLQKSCLFPCTIGNSLKIYG